MALRDTDVPLPTGTVLRKIPSGSAGAVAWPGAENYLLSGPGGDGQLGPINRPERFWLVCGAHIIRSAAASGWIRMDYQLRLLVNGAYGNDLRGVNLFMKTDSIENHSNSWVGSSVSAMFYCERNTNYHVRLLSKNTTSNVSYWYGSPEYYTFFIYTIGEGKYEVNTSGP